MQNYNDQLYDIYGMEHIPFWQTDAFYIGMLIIGALLIALGSWWAVRLWRLRKKPELPAWEKALIALNKLSAQESMTVERSKQFYDTLTMIIKRYLHERYDYDIMGKTDQELLIYLEGVSFDVALLDMIRNILQGSVLIKFANAQGMREQMERDIASSIIIIKKTIPVVHHSGRN